jgi:hypothetical protein
MVLAFAHSLSDIAAQLPVAIAAMVQQDDPAAVGESVASVAVDQFKQCERFLTHFASDDAIRSYIVVCECPRDYSLKVFEQIVAAGMEYGEKFLFAEFFGDFADRVFVPRKMGGKDAVPLSSGTLSEVMIGKVVMEVVTFVVQWRSVEEQTTFENSLHITKI